MPTAGHRLRDLIEDEILTGHLGPGERLEEEALAARFTVSRTPVREALHHLATAGLVELRPRRGAVVAVPGPERLVEMFEVMAELEGLCGRLAARRLTPEARAALLAAHEACAQARGDADAYYYRNERFHHVIYAASATASSPSRPKPCTSASSPTAACSCACATGSRPRSGSTRRLSARSSTATRARPAGRSGRMFSSRASASRTSSRA
jgi:DNA-binding transcriptional regulator YhcF (GntR family)